MVLVARRQFEIGARRRDHDVVGAESKNGAHQSRCDARFRFPAHAYAAGRRYQHHRRMIDKVLTSLAPGKNE
jgi:hypothetical protein